MKCRYCLKKAKLVSGKIIYPHRPDLKEKLFWLCKPCDAYVGCHGNTNKPLGRLANKELRFWKQEAHKNFDPLWRLNGRKRTEAYKLLAVRLDIPYRECHIGMFDIKLCKQTVEISKKLRRAR